MVSKLHHLPTTKTFTVFVSVLIVCLFPTMGGLSLLISKPKPASMRWISSLLTYSMTLFNHLSCLTFTPLYHPNQQQTCYDIPCYKKKNKKPLVVPNCSLDTIPLLFHLWQESLRNLFNLDVSFFFLSWNRFFFNSKFHSYLPTEAIFINVANDFNCGKSNNQFSFYFIVFNVFQYHLQA